MIPSNCLLLSSDRPDDLGQPRLAGYATTDEALVLGRHGLEQYLAAGHSAADIREGRFIGVFPNGATTTIKTDRTGQEQMFLFRNGSVWAVSNSFFLLAMHVAKAHRLTLYPPALMSFHLKSGRHIGEQLVSHKTPVAEIQMIPATTELIVDRTSGKLTLKSHDFFEAFLPSAATYEELLLHLLQNRIRLLAAIGQLGNEINLFLSGGYDSRVVLGLALTAGCTDALTITSREGAVADYTSAKGMVDALGLPLNQSQNRPTQTIASPLDSLRLWMLSCGGTYLPFYRVSSYSADPNPFIKLTGDQPTSWDHYVGRAKFNGTAEKIAADIVDDLLDREEGGAVASDFLGTFFDIGVEPDHPKAMTAYYSATRSRHHCGRHWYKSLGGSRLVTPLTHSNWIGLEFLESRLPKNPKQLFADVFSALSIPELSLPFETPNKAFESELLEASPFKGGVSFDTTPLAVFGDLAEPENGEMASLMDVPLPAKTSDEDMKAQLAHTFWMSERTRDCGVFNEADVLQAKREISENGGVSTSFRKVSHFAMSESILAVIEASGP